MSVRRKNRLLFRTREEGQVFDDGGGGGEVVVALMVVVAAGGMGMGVDLLFRMKNLLHLSNYMAAELWSKEQKEEV